MDKIVISPPLPSKETMKIQYLLETLEMLISVQLKTSSVGLA